MTCQHNTWRDADEVNGAGHAVTVRYCRERGCAYVISETLRSPLVGGPVMMPTATAGELVVRGQQSAIGHAFERIERLEKALLAACRHSVRQIPGVDTRCTCQWCGLRAELEGRDE